MSKLSAVRLRLISAFIARVFERQGKVGGAAWVSGSIRTGAGQVVPLERKNLPREAPRETACWRRVRSWPTGRTRRMKLLDLDTENKARGSLTHFFGGRVPKVNIRNSSTPFHTDHERLSAPRGCNRSIPESFKRRRILPRARKDCVHVAWRRGVEASLLPGAIEAVKEIVSARIQLFNSTRHMTMPSEMHLSTDRVQKGICCRRIARRVSPSKSPYGKEASR